MINKNVITSAVSPLKRKKSYKGGTKIKKAATKTAKRRGGFAESTATSNKPGYNVKTSFVARSGKAPTGTKTVPSPQKPYSFDKDGKIQVNPMATKKWTDPVTDSRKTTEKTEKARSSYQDSYDAMEDKDGGKYNPRNKKTYTSFEEYEKEAIQFNKDNPDYKEYETKTVTKRETTPGFWTYYDENGGEISKEEYSKYKNKK